MPLRRQSEEATLRATQNAKAIDKFERFAGAFKRATRRELDWWSLECPPEIRIVPVAGPYFRDDQGVAIPAVFLPGEGAELIAAEVRQQRKELLSTPVAEMTDDEVMAIYNAFADRCEASGSEESPLCGVMLLDDHNDAFDEMIERSSAIEELLAA
jgi:hypothetical protein